MFSFWEQLAQTLAALVTSILAGPRVRVDAERITEPPLRQIIEVLQQVTCTHDAEKLAISVLEIYEDGYHQYGCDFERDSSRHGSVTNQFTQRQSIDCKQPKMLSSQSL
jgi:hypothetical protein